MVGSSVHLLYGCDEMTDIVEPKHAALKWMCEMQEKEIESLRQQIAECQAENEKLRVALRQSCEDHRSESMYECGMYCAESESTIKRAKREALLEAIETLVNDEAYNIEKGYGSAYLPAINELRRMAKELE